ncbi:unnamed protein product [Gemmata massiliana]|uniref:Uncharacterized protein n=1 Tax=Gemmata massiliana TaxID=1210884 RepID=A0A6P2D1M6_9BACT|nr:hypothetical protein [Gemmata massiliana]VTR94486.1 unnamed protein product [Gemmata massiliana]
MKQYFKDNPVLGNIAWHPVLRSGTPVDLTMLPLRVATLFTLPELREMAARGGTPQIILAIGPCSDPECPETKKDLLRWVIESKPTLAHHIFVDRRSAANYLGERKDD